MVLLWKISFLKKGFSRTYRICVFLQNTYFECFVKLRFVDVEGFITAPLVVQNLPKIC